ncbi:unnamed protein product [Periconia digitata]|uniref:Uncharacterized protein n=1 Tax=Periconia digitata TaxID=1303443 RepID=A0A9W4U3D6_9PLEO|nr:unnamed protein product [Periconia digitata]
MQDGTPKRLEKEQMAAARGTRVVDIVDCSNVGPSSPPAVPHRRKKTKKRQVVPAAAHGRGRAQSRGALCWCWLMSSSTASYVSQLLCCRCSVRVSSDWPFRHARCLDQSPPITSLPPSRLLRWLSTTMDACFFLGYIKTTRMHDNGGRSSLTHLPRPSTDRHGNYSLPYLPRRPSSP